MSEKLEERETDKRKRQALRLAAHAAKKHEETGSSRRGAMRFAREQGATLREISEATGVPHVTVKRLIDREEAQ